MLWLPARRTPSGAEIRANSDGENRGAALRLPSSRPSPASGRGSLLARPRRISLARSPVPASAAVGFGRRAVGLPVRRVVERQAYLGGFRRAAGEIENGAVAFPARGGVPGRFRRGVLCAARFAPGFAIRLRQRLEDVVEPAFRDARDADLHQPIVMEAIEDGDVTAGKILVLQARELVHGGAFPADLVARARVGRGVAGPALAVGLGHLVDRHADRLAVDVQSPRRTGTGCRKAQHHQDDRTHGFLPVLGS